MKSILVVHPRSGEERIRVRLLGCEAEVLRVGCGGDSGRARELISGHDGTVDAIALEGIPFHLQLGAEQVLHERGVQLARAAERTPVVDGSGIRPGLERWAMTVAERARPGLFSDKRVLMVPGLNHTGLAHAFTRWTDHVRYADPALFFGLPRIPGIGRPATLEKVARATLGSLSQLPFERLRPRPDRSRPGRAHAWFRWADVLAGDAGTIRAFAPARLARKTVVLECAGEEDLDDLRRRGVAVAVTLMPALDGTDAPGRCSAATLEAVLAAFRRDPALPLSEDTYLDMLSEIEWTPSVLELQPGEAGVNRFAFVIHPLDLSFIRRHPWFRWTRHLPDRLVESAAAHLPPFFVSKVTGGRSPTTGQRIEGHLIALGATPRQMMKRSPAFTYRRLSRAARMAESRGARLMGLGAFTSVVGDAGVSVASRAPISVTSGNSLTVSATLEAAKQAVRRMGKEPPETRVMVIGATGSIGSVCARMMARTTRDIVLVSIEPERLIELKRLILRETPGARVVLSTRARGLAADCDVIVTATSAFGQRVLDISECAPGAIVCDVARPPDISPEEAATRPDVLVIESGEVLIPGDVDFGYDIGLPPGVSYACLAETALLTMEGRFESFTLGRELSVDRVKEIYRLFRKHGFELAGLRSLGRFQTEADLEAKRALARTLLDDPGLFERTRREAARRLAEIPVAAKGVRGTPRVPAPVRESWLAGGVHALTLWLGRH